MRIIQRRIRHRNQLLGSSRADKIKRPVTNTCFAKHAADFVTSSSLCWVAEIRKTYRVWVIREIVGGGRVGFGGY